jgi:hypothetical protein
MAEGLTDVGTNHRITWTNVHSTLVKSFTQWSDQPGENIEVLEPCSTPSSS